MQHIQKPSVSDRDSPFSTRELLLAMGGALLWVFVSYVAVSLLLLPVHPT